MDQTVIELTPKQIEYIQNANHRWNFAVGAVRSGKSHLAVQYLIPKCIRERAGKKGINLILGASKENIERNVLTPMRDLWGDVFVSEINSRNVATLFGERVYCIGAESSRQVSKIRGSEVKFCYCDEIVDINKEVFEILKSRLSLPYSICHAAANPSYPSHFIKKFLESSGDGVDIYAQKYTVYDNPFLPPGYVKSLEAEYQGTVYFARYILGEWARAEGLIYPMYQQALGKPPEGVPVVERALSIDYGTQNAFAALLWHKVGGVWYAVDEYYYSGRDTGIQKTDDEYLKDLEIFLKDEIDSGKLRTIIDPSAASFIALLKRTKWAKVKKADNDVLDGIRETASAMKKGLIKLSPDIKDLIRELEGYVWDESTTSQERPIKEEDHACLTGETKVQTPQGLKQIKDLEGTTGEIYAYDYNGNIVIKHYSCCMKTRENAEILKVTLKDGSVIKGTPDHKIMTESGWKALCELNGNDSVLMLSDMQKENIVMSIGVRKVEKVKNEDVYNLNVDDVHNYILENGAISKNCDALRYFVKTMRVAQEKQNYKPVWN